MGEENSIYSKRASWAQRDERHQKCVRAKVRRRLTEKLAKVLGIYQEPVVPPGSQSVTVNQVNLSGGNSLEAARRLAFAKLSHTGSPRPLIEAHGVVGDPKK